MSPLSTKVKSFARPYGFTPWAGKVRIRLGVIIPFIKKN